MRQLNKKMTDSMRHKHSVVIGVASDGKPNGEAAKLQGAVRVREAPRANAFSEENAVHR